MTRSFIDGLTGKVIYSVHGLNLSVPEDAKELIKPWAEREDTDRYAESGVDDSPYPVNQCI